MHNTKNKLSTLTIGQHALLDLFGVDATCASQPERIREIMLQAAQLAGAHVLEEYFHHFGENSGITGVLLLSESHMSIHTWPERQFAAIDIFMCGEHQMQQATDYLKKALSAQTVQLTIHQRGNV